MSEAVSSYPQGLGSGSLLSGDPYVVAFYEDYINNIDYYINEAVSKVVTKYEKKLRRKALLKGWRSSAKSLSVSYDRENMEIAIQGDFAKEYGTGLEPPRPIVRSAIADIDQLERMVNKSIQKDLF